MSLVLERARSVRQSHRSRRRKRTPPSDSSQLDDLITATRSPPCIPCNIVRQSPVRAFSRPHTRPFFRCPHRPHLKPLCLPSLLIFCNYLGLLLIRLRLNIGVVWCRLLETPLLGRRLSKEFSKLDELRVRIAIPAWFERRVRWRGHVVLSGCTLKPAPRLVEVQVRNRSPLLGFV